MPLFDKVTVPEGTSGPWAVQRFTVSAEDAKFGYLRAALKGRGAVPPGTYTRLTFRGGVVMSDTPDEMLDHLQPVRRAYGRCLITGLGLGMVLGAMLKRASVEHVTVVEIDRDVISLVAPHYSADPRVEIVHADAFSWRPPRGTRFNVAWHDIWPDICADNLPQMTRLKRRFGSKCDWQGCWSERQCRRHRNLVLSL